MAAPNVRLPFRTDDDFERMSMEAAAVELRVGHDLPYDELVTLYDSVGWKAYTVSRRRPDLPKALRNSTYVVSAWLGDRLVGLARGLSDDVSVFYLQDVLVLPAYQRRGIGAQLVHNCLDHYKHVRMHILISDGDERITQFYESLGFKKLRDLQETPLNAFIRVQGVSLG
jgi:GNAT superfamily N-acetyltransferase